MVLFCPSAAWRINFSPSGVRNGPGQTVLTRMPDRPNSLASDLLNAATPARKNAGDKVGCPRFSDSDTGDVNDTPPSRLFHIRSDQTAEPNNGEQNALIAMLPVILVEIGERAHLWMPNVGDEGVNACERFNGLLHQPLDVLSLCEIANDGQYPRASFAAYRLRRLIERLFVLCTDNYVYAFTSQCGCARPAQSLARRTNDGDFSQSKVQSPLMCPPWYFLVFTYSANPDIYAKWRLMRNTFLPLYWVNIQIVILATSFVNQFPSNFLLTVSSVCGIVSGLHIGAKSNTVLHIFLLCLSREADNMANPPYILSIDQGTTGSTVLLIDAHGEITAHGLP